MKRGAVGAALLAVVDGTASAEDKAKVAELRPMPPDWGEELIEFTLHVCPCPTGPNSAACKIGQCGFRAGRCTHPAHPRNVGGEDFERWYARLCARVAEDAQRWAV